MIYICKFAGVYFKALGSTCTYQSNPFDDDGDDDDFMKTLGNVKIQCCMGVRLCLSL
jgi:hypothetical protein